MDTLFIVLFGLLLLVLLGVRPYIRDSIWHKHLPKGPRPVPFFGNMFDIRPRKRQKIWHSLAKFQRLYGDAFTVYFGPVRAVFFNRADIIHEALVVQSKTFSSRPNGTMLDMFGLPVGVARASGSVWQARRRLLMRAMRDFGMGRAGIVDVVHDELNFLVEELSRKSISSQPFRPHLLISNTISNMICSLLFGKRFNYDDQNFLKLLKLMNEIFSTSFSSPKRLIFTVMPILRKFARSSQVDRAFKMHAHVAKLMEEAINNHVEDFSPQIIRDFIDLYIQQDREGEEGDRINLDDYTWMMVDLFTAATETSATALTWTIFFMAKNPELQKECQVAVEKVIPSSRLPLLNDRPQLTILDAVMCEVLRHVSVAPLAQFHAVYAGAKVGQFEIPEDTVIGYNVWAVHHDPAYWKDPFEFNPKRWLDDNGNLINHGRHFLPFGTGPRICLGESMARVEYFISLATLLRRFNFRFPNGASEMEYDDGIQGLTHLPPPFDIEVSLK